MEGIGKLITGDAAKDAIHVAIAPVVAAVDLIPGMRIGFIAGSTTDVANQTIERREIVPIGIVDPFLNTTILKGNRFFMFLYPNTVTSLRHEWTHPAFPSQANIGQSADKQFSEQWLRVYAEKMNRYDDHETAFQNLIAGLRSGDLFANGRDLHGLFDVDDSDELRRHAENYLGITIDWSRFSFSCSC